MSRIQGGEGMKPTPGPWGIGFASDDSKVQIISADGYHLAYIEQEPLYPNARLIASSPELSECVSSFVRRFGVAVECDEEINGGDAVDWISENMAGFKNAMKKAEGGD